MVATVTGNLVAVTGSARAGVELQFEPRSLPLAEEGSLVVSPSTSVTTDANGDFTAALVAGDYRLVVGDDEASLALTGPSGTSASNRGHRRVVDPRIAKGGACTTSRRSAPAGVVDKCHRQDGSVTASH